MKGNAKRDYPASIGEQSPWHPHYHLIEDHFARVECAADAGPASRPHRRGASNRKSLAAPWADACR